MAKKRLSDFNYLDDNQSQNYLASHWPNGQLTSKRFVSDSVIYKFIKCLGTIIKFFTGHISTIAKNTDISKADELLTEWETSVRIPEIISKRDTVDGRKEAVEILISKIAVYNIQNKIGLDIDTTIEEFVRKLTGIEIEIEMASNRSSTSDFPLTFPFTFGFSIPERNSVFIIKVPIEGSVQNNIFPMTFPISFFVPSVPQEIQDLLSSALDRVIPAYAVWIFEVIPA